MKKLPVTVCIPTKNDGNNLEECLASLNNRFEYVVVVDSSSNDATQEIAKKYNAEVINFIWNGKFPKKRNFYLRNFTIKTEWVLFLDADERVTGQFVDELIQTLPNSDCVGYWIGFRNWFMSRELKFGDKFRKLPLIKWRFGEYENYPELEWTKIDVEVNEHPVLKGKVGYLKSALSHHEYRGLEQYIYKHNIYSTHEAKRYIWLTSPLGEEYWNAFGFRQKIKYKLLDKYWLCLIYFFYSYFLKLGFLDGVPGFAFHTVKLRTLFDTALKIRDFQGKGMLASSLIDSDFKQNMPISNGP